MRVVLSVAAVLAYTAAAICASVSLATAPQAAASIEDVQNIVIFMQENRAFDHYYGTLDGVRGFNDRAAPALQDGSPPFKQPFNGRLHAIDKHLLPFHLSFNKSAATCMPAPEMAYPSDVGIINGGWGDRWNTAREPGFGMAYFDRTDLPFYYAMADSWTIGDQYFQSTQTATNPNRQFLFSGRNCDGNITPPDNATVPTFCHLDDDESEGLKWETMAETLQAANVSWRVLQENDNFDDNAFEWFQSFIDAKPGSLLFDNGVKPVPDIVHAFGDMVAADALPQVTWIIAPASLSEHANNHPADGEDLTARLMRALGSNPKVYSKTVFILNYDEGGQFYDHHWVPLPPSSPADGKSTVTTMGELLPVAQQGIPAGTPYGLGFRVPLVIVSPWTRGHLVYSEVCDHTSVIKFVEKRFKVKCPNVSPWRRAIVGDLSAAFDWANPDFTWPALPSTERNVNASAWQCAHNPPPRLPLFQKMPVQEPGSRVLRPLPYVLSVTAAAASAASLQLTFESLGNQGAAFQVYNLADPSLPPRKYTVGAAASLDDEWPVSGDYSLAAYGPNGFVRKFSGSATAAALYSTALLYHTENNTVSVVVSAAAAAPPCAFSLSDPTYNNLPPTDVQVLPGSAAPLNIDTAASFNWYDVLLSIQPSSACPFKTSDFSRVFMGHMETSKASASDPALSRSIKELAELPELRMPADLLEATSFDATKRLLEQTCSSSRRARMKDMCWDNGDAVLSKPAV